MKSICLLLFQHSKQTLLDQSGGFFYTEPLSLSLSFSCPLSVMKVIFAEWRIKLLIFRIVKNYVKKIIYAMPNNDKKA